MGSRYTSPLKLPLPLYRQSNKAAIKHVIANIDMPKLYNYAVADILYKNLPSILTLLENEMICT